MLRYFLVALGGAAGTLARFWVGTYVSNAYGAKFPWGTLLINITGSFLIGVFFTLTTEGPSTASPTTRAFLMTGICGGYTTFSAFSLETLNLMRGGEWFRAGANCVASVVLCLIAVYLGHVAAMAVNHLKGS